MRFNWPLALLIVISILIRWYWAQKLPIWLDEANVMVAVKQLSTEDILWLKWWDASHPPLFNLFMQGWVNLGTTAGWVRFPEVVVSSLSMIYLYRLIRNWIKKKWVAELTLLYAAFSAVLIPLSIYVRPYALIQFTVLGYWYYLITYLKMKSNRGELAKLAIINCIGVWSDYSYWWWVMSSSVVLVGWTWINRQKVNWHGTAKVLVITWIPIWLWLPVFINRFTDALVINQYLQQNLHNNVIEDINFMVNWWVNVYSANFDHYLWLIYVGVILMWGWLYQKEKDQWGKLMVLLSLAVLVLPLIINLGISYGVSSLFNLRNIFIIYYGFIFGLAALSKVINKYVLAGIALVFIVFQYMRIERQINFYTNWKGVREAQIIRSKINQAESVMVVLEGGLAKIKPIFEYYFKGMDGGNGCKQCELVTTINKKQSSFVLIREINMSVEEQVLSGLRCEVLTLPENYGTGLVSYWCER